MREIKFRAWDKTHNSFHEQTHRLMIRLDGKVYNSEYGDTQCDRFIIEQHAGIKDKNGVEIYEGDIIPYGNRSYEVEYSAPYFTLKGYFIMDYYGHDAPELQDWSEFEVIGNIHENPELLEQS